MSIQQYLFVFLAYLVVVFSITSQAFYAPLNFEDEHQLLNAAEPNLPIKLNIDASEDFSILSNYIMDEVKLGRLKPVSRIIPWCIVRMSNANPLVLHLYLLLCVASTLTLFFTFLKKLNVRTWIALLGGLVLFAGKYDEVWWRIGPGELLALLFLLAGLITTLNYVHKKSDSLYIPILLYSLSAFSKESFAFLLPVSVILLLFNNNFSARNKKIIIGISSVFLIYLTLLIVILFNNGSTYGWESDVSFMQLAKENLKSFTKPWLLWIPIIVWIIISPNKKTITTISIAFIVWTCIQLTIHYKVLVIDYTRYLLPAQLFIITVSILSINHIWVLKKKIGIILIILIGFYCVYGLKNTMINSSYFGKRATAYHSILNDIAKEKTRNILLVLNTNTPTEHITAAATFLSKKGIAPSIEYTRVHEKQDNNSIIQQYYGSLKKKEHPYFNFLKTADPVNYDVILFLEPKETLPSEFGKPKNHIIQKRTEKYFHFSFRSLLIDKKQSSNSISYLTLIKN